MLQEFKAFAIRGNVIDLAVGVIIGGAFGKIVDSLVGDLIMPMVSALIGRLDFSNLFIALGAVPAGTGSSLDARSEIFRPYRSCWRTWPCGLRRRVGSLTVPHTSQMKAF